MADVPAFTATPNAGGNLLTTRISAANTNRDGTGTTYVILTGGAAGTRVDRIQWKATGVTTAGVIRIYLKDTGTPSIRLLYEALIAAATPSATVLSASGEWARSDGQPLILLPAGWTVLAATHNAEVFDVVAVVAGDF
jgi:hypothetical protein